MMASEIDVLHAAVRKASVGDPRTRATARLLRAGRGKIAKKVIEEAAEVALACAAGDRKAVVRETADLFYNLVVLLAAMDVRPAEVWDEMADRKEALGLAAKRPKKRARDGWAGARRVDGQGEPPT